MENDFLVKRGWFTGEELDAARGPWNADKISVVKRYLQHPTTAWTRREIWITERLQEALDFIDAATKKAAS
jgi:hypothetical protein